MIETVLEVRLVGWTATPRMPFVLSGNAVCLPVPTYSSLLGLIGCCLGRLVEAGEVEIGFRYEFDSVAKDLETRQRLEFDGKRIKPHTKGSDAYSREFHVSPRLTLWLNQVEWEHYFVNPVGTPSLGRSQDILKIESVKQVKVKRIDEAEISGCMIPFVPELKIGGQLIQLAEAFQENEEIGTGRRSIRNGIFMAVPGDKKGKVRMSNLYETIEIVPQYFYLHRFNE